MSEFSSQFKVGHYLLVNKIPENINRFPVPGLYTISATGINGITLKQKINSKDYNWLILTVNFTTLRETISYWKVFDRKISKNMVKQLYG